MKILKPLNILVILYTLQWKEALKISNLECFQIIWSYKLFELLLPPKD